MKKYIALFLSLALFFGTVYAIPTQVYADNVLYGDVNADSSVNGKDSLILRQFLAEWNVKADKAAADCNGDARVNSKDSLLLRQFLADWEVSLGSSNSDWTQNYATNCLLYSSEPTDSKSCTMSSDNTKSLSLSTVSYDYSFMLTNEGGYASFDLNGKYKSLAFSAGFADKYDANSTDSTCLPFDNSGIIEVSGDGELLKKITLEAYSTVHQICIDVSGVKALTFTLVEGDGYRYAIGSAAAFSDSVPDDFFPSFNKPSSEKQLISSNYLYSINRGSHALVYDSTSTNSFKMGNDDFNSGLVFNYGEKSVYFNLKKQFDYIEFYLGRVIGNSNNNGRGELHISVDGVDIYNRVMTSDMENELITLDVKGATQLKITTDNNNPSINAATYGIGDLVGLNSDRASVCNNPLAYRDNCLVYSSMPTASERCEIYENPCRPLGLATVKYNYSLMLTIKDSYVSYDLGGKYKKMAFAVGYADLYNESASSSESYYNPTDYSGTITVTGDNKTLKTIQIDKNSLGKQLTLDVSGVNSLKFTLTEGDGSRYAICSPAVFEDAVPEDFFPSYDKPDIETELVCPDYIYSETRGSNIIICDNISTNPESILLGSDEFDTGLTFKDGGNAYLNLKGQFDYVTFMLGRAILDNYSYSMDGELHISADGEEIYQQLLNSNMDNTKITLDTANVKQLVISVNCHYSTGYSAAFALCDIRGVNGADRDTDNNVIKYRDNYLVYNSDPIESEWVTEYTNVTKPLTIANETCYYSMVMTRSDSYATYDIGGKYKTLCFMLGNGDSFQAELQENSDDYYFNNNSDDSGYVSIYGDGKRIEEFKIDAYSLGSNYTVDISGVNELKFVGNTDVDDIVNFAFGAVTVWEDEVPDDVFPTYEKATATTNLVAKPYLYDNDRCRGHYICDGVCTNHNAFTMSGDTYTQGFAFTDFDIIGGSDGSHMRFNLRNQFKYISFIVGHCDKSDTGYGTQKLIVYADEKKIYSLDMPDTMITQFVSLDVNYARKLDIVIEMNDNTTFTFSQYGIANLYGSATELSHEFEVDEPKVAARLISDVDEPYRRRYNGDADEATAKVFNSSKVKYFTMGGVDFYEGFALRPSNTMLDGLCASYACFDLGRVYENLTFTAGHIDWTPMKGYTLKILGDGKLLREIEMDAFMLPTDYTVNVSGVRQLIFQIDGVKEFYHAAMGIANLAVYSGDVTDDELFIKDSKVLATSGSLLEITKPYTFKTYAASTLDEAYFIDDEYVTINGIKHYNAMLMKSNVALDIESVDSEAMLLMPEAFLTGGAGYFKSYSVFNIRGQYKKFSFTVEPADDCKADQILEIVIGDELVKTVELKSDGGPQTFEFDVTDAPRIGFMLGGKDTDGSPWDGTYALYDMLLS